MPARDTGARDIHHKLHTSTDPYRSVTGITHYDLLFLIGPGG